MFVRGERLEKFNLLANNIMVHDLSKGIPFNDDSVDVVYHSHTLEHLERDVAEKFLMEIKRVLKPGGIQRIVVPDFEKACKDYVAHIAYCEDNPNESDNHDDYIAAMIEQSVRKEAFSAKQQNPVQRVIESVILGDARRRGETHQWMYDRINLKAKLIKCGFNKVCVQNYNLSEIPNWNDYKLDTDKWGNQYKPGSLYIEARK